VVDGEARDYDIEAGLAKRQGAHIPGFDVHAIGNAFERGIAQRDIPGVAGLIVRAPDVDPGRATVRQPPRDRSEHSAAPATHIEHALIAAQAGAIENGLPLEKLPPSRRVEEADGHTEEEDEIACRHPRGPTRSVPPFDRGDDAAD